MATIYARNVSEALHRGLGLLKERGVWQESRSGSVIEYPSPVTTTYKRPEERVLFYKNRDANPFFHLFESIWMLAGRDDVEYLSNFNKRMEEYSDDGHTLHGAYGYRWREYFLTDQLDWIVLHLKEFPESRRAVLAMWCPDDLKRIIDSPECNDVPCNTQVYFKIRSGCLDMTVTCRSNDIIWGAFGANAVHFSILLEYIAARIGVPMGNYYQMSDSFHAYKEPYEKCLKILDGDESGLWYDSYIGWNHGMHYTPEPMFPHPDSIDEDVKKFIERTSYIDGVRYIENKNKDMTVIPSSNFVNPFFAETAYRMFFAWSCHKIKDYDKALAIASEISALDWRKASIEWLERRKERWELENK
jgi:thymidylate synthase